MKKSLAIVSFLFITLFSFAGCNNTAKNTAYENSELGIKFQSPDDWNVVPKNNTTVEIQNSSDAEQIITINKFKSISEKTDIWSWFEENKFPAPAAGYKEITVGEVPALKAIQGNTVIVPQGKQYFMIQDCLDLSCKTVNESTFQGVLNSIQFTK